MSILVETMVGAGVGATEAINRFDGLAGVETLVPGDAGYEDAGRTFFATGEPALVVRPRNADGIAAALTRAVDHGMAVSVRSGGHSYLGYGTNDGGMVVDLTHLDDVEVLDADRRLVRVGAGATWGRVAAALDSRAWSITAGDTASVGVGGLTLGGGFGWMVRQYGLAIDNLVGARVVTADGRLIRATEQEHPELFWALRGGGGNFGVVVDFDFVAQPVASVHFGSITYEPDDAATLLRRWRDAMRAAPDVLSSTFALLPGAAMVLLCFAADSATDAGAAAAIEPLLAMGTVIEANISQRRYGEILEEAAPRPGVRLVGRNTLVRTLDENVVRAIEGMRAGSAPSVVAVRSLGGAFGRVPSDATAFAHRDAEAMVIGMLMLPADATDAEVERALAPWRRVAAQGIGTYVNFQGSATPDDLVAAYPRPTYDRLAAVKRAYDPHNLFAANHNILPAAA